jgi:hypothetical protein
LEKLEKKKQKKTGRSEWVALCSMTNERLALSA